MKDTKYLEIIKAPVITEKSQAALEEGKYTFKVDPKANKTEIKAAIEKIFKVKVTSIKTINEKPKKGSFPAPKRRGSSLFTFHIVSS